ncbi:MAG: type I-E CRISPR-associated protein Cse1/CasA [Verrucomicrobiota bacterium]
MNLTSDPWIPAVCHNGKSMLYSLQEMFAQAHELRDLAVKPHERIALMRLLICISQAALDGPQDEEDWEDCLQSIQPLVKEYLENRKTKFDLFGDSERFLQVSNLKPSKDTDEGNSSTKLDLSLATGNNSTLFDNSAGDNRSVSASRAALNLLTFQCFSPGGRIGVAKWHGKDTLGKGSSNHAPCVSSSMLHALLLGDSLLDTIHLNLLTKAIVGDVYSRFGKPIWDCPPIDAADQSALENASSSYLGRLVPLTRFVCLAEDGNKMLLANGLDYPIFPTYREATATIIQKKDDYGLMPASTDRSLWRQLAPVTIRRRSSGDSISGPLALSHEVTFSEVGLWVGALVTDKAKIEDVVEAQYRIPRSMLDTPGRLAYERGVKYAEIAESILIQAVKVYASQLEVLSPAYNKARQHFWTITEQSLPELFDVAREFTIDEELPESGWGKAVRSAALEAYQQSCPRQTPRQIQAYALGLRRLNAVPKPKIAKNKKGNLYEQNQA